MKEHKSTNKNIRKVHADASRNEGQLSRKETRKKIRIQKKQRKKTNYGPRKAIKTITIQTKINANTKNKLTQTKKGIKNIVKRQEKEKLQSPTGKAKMKRAKKAPLVRDLHNSQDQKDPFIIQQQRQIQYYEQQLGVTSKKKKSTMKGMAKGMGYDDDLFDFLDNITNKVKGSASSYKYQDHSEQDLQMMNQEQSFQLGEESGQEQEQGQDQDQVQDQEQEQKQWKGRGKGRGQRFRQQQGQKQRHSQEELLQNVQDREDLAWVKAQLQKDAQQSYVSQMDEIDIDPAALQEQYQYEVGQIHKKNKQKYMKNGFQMKGQKDQQPSEPERPSLFKATTKDQSNAMQIKKKFNAVFNKLSDGNLLFSYRQCAEVFLSHSKAQVIPVFLKIFLKFNVEIEKPHLHILLSNIALACGLHQLLGNRLMAPLVSEIVARFIQLESQEDNHAEIEEIGYSRLFEKKKNCVTILSYFYQFGSLTGEFIHSFVKELSHTLNREHIELIYQIIQKIGVKIRQNDPGILKLIIDQLKQTMSQFKRSHSQGEIEKDTCTKIEIIQLQLNELRFNRVKDPTFKDQRLAFMNTFLTKNIPNEVGIEKQRPIMLLNYEQVKQADISLTNWWEHVSKAGAQEGKGEQNQFSDQDCQGMIGELTEQKRQLLNLAKSLHLVTQTRKSIFVEIMQSEDFIEATQRVLALKIKNLQEIATVLVHVCVLEPTFNPFYSLVAAKVASLQPKFRMSVQFACWDQLKLIESFPTRKTSNLAKFMARFLANSLSNASLSMLKFFPDFVDIPSSSALFLIIFFTEFLSHVRKQTLIKAAHKLKENNNRPVKQSLLDYLSEVGIRQKGFGNIEKMKFLRKLLLIESQQDERERQ